MPPEPLPLEILKFVFADAREIPNNSRLPLVVYPRSVAPGADLARHFELLLPRGGWCSAWRWGVYPFPHYHSTAHEVLAVFRGTASLRLGHSTGVTIEVSVGDAIIIPAGVGHQNLGSSADFQVVGGYPEGQEADLLRAQPEERPAADRRIEAVPLPTGDPIFGADGPLRKLWGLE